MNMTTFELRSIGRVESTLTALDQAPRQADEGAPSAWLVFEEEVREGLANLRRGDQLIVLTWLDRARRDVLVVHPRGEADGLKPFALDAPTRKSLGAVAKGQHRQRRGAHDDAER